MRKLFLGLAIILVLLVGAVFLAALNLDRWVNENRDVVAAEAQTRLGRDVSFGEIGISFAGGLAVRLDDLRVGDDPAFSKDDFLTAQAIDVRVGIVPALFGSIEIGRIVLREPSIRVIQTAKGLSIDSLGGGGDSADEAAEGGAPPALLVSLVDIRDGSLRWEDRTAKPPVDLRVERLDFTASNVSLTEPVEFELEAALFGASDRNASVSGIVGPVQSDAPRVDLKLRIDPLAIADARRLAPDALPADLDAEGGVSVSLDVSGTLAALRFDARVDASRAAVRYGESFDKAAGKSLVLTLAGEKRGNDVELETLNLRVDRTELAGRATVKNLDDPKVDFALRTDVLELAAFGAAEPGSPDALRDLELSGQVTLAGAGPNVTAALRSPSGSVSGADYRDLALDLRLANERAEIRKLSANLFDGSITATGSYDMKRAKPLFDLKTESAGMRVEKILESQSDSSGSVTGELRATLALRGAGSEWEEIKPTLVGGGEVAIREGELKDFNPAGETLRALLSLPAFSGSGIGQFVQRHPKVFGVGDTSFEEVAGTIDVRDGWVYVKGLELDVRDYVVRGEGRYSLDNEVDFRSQLRFSAPLSEELIAAEPRMRYLRASDGRVELPVAFRGSPPKIAAVPDVSRVAQGAARGALTDALTGALGGKQKQPASEPSGETPTAPAEQTAPAAKTPEELGTEALKKGLGGLFGGGRPSEPPPEAPPKE